MDQKLTIRRPAGKFKPYSDSTYVFSAEKYVILHNVGTRNISGTQVVSRMLAFAGSKGAHFVSVLSAFAFIVQTFMRAELC